MDDDRKLLEMAARAAGLADMRWTGPLGMVRMLDPSRPETTGSIGGYWNPRDDDGQAFRLAVRLRMEVYQGINCDEWTAFASYTDGERIRYMTEAYGDHGDPYAATRLAVLRAAAAIGEKRG